MVALLIPELHIQLPRILYDVFPWWQTECLTNDTLDSASYLGPAQSLYITSPCASPHCDQMWSRLHIIVWVLTQFLCRQELQLQTLSLAGLANFLQKTWKENGKCWWCNLDSKAIIYYKETLVWLNSLLIPSLITIQRNVPIVL